TPGADAIARMKERDERVERRKVEKVRAIGVGPAPLRDSRGISKARGGIHLSGPRAKVRAIGVVPREWKGRCEQVRHTRGAIASRVLRKPHHPTPPAPPCEGGEMPG